MNSFSFLILLFIEYLLYAREYSGELNTPAHGVYVLNL